MYNKVQLLLTLNRNNPPDLCEVQLAAEGERICRLLPPGAHHLRAIRLSDDPTRQTAYATELSGEQDSFDVVFEVGAQGAEWSILTLALNGLTRNLAAWIVPQKSAVIAGSEHVIIPGECPLLLVYALRRLPALTSRQFHDYWLNKHAEVARTIPVLRAYRQFHADEKATSEAARELGIAIADFDGAAQGYYREIKDFMDIMTQPEVVADAIEDEKRFIDIPRSAMGLYRIAWNQQV